MYFVDIARCFSTSRGFVSNSCSCLFLRSLYFTEVTRGWTWDFFPELVRK